MSADAFSFAGGVPYEALCPTTMEVCPSRVETIGLYSSVTDPNIELPTEVRPALDGIKMNIKLGEHATRAVASGCEGVVDGQCPTRLNMDNSHVRKGIVAIVRTVIGKK